MIIVIKSFGDETRHGSVRMWQVLDMTWKEIGGKMMREKTVEQCQQKNKKRPTKHNMTKQNISSKLLSDFLRDLHFAQL